MVYSGGLKIYATIDTKVQDALDSVYTDDSAFPNTEKYGEVPESAMVITDKQGDIVAIAQMQGRIDELMNEQDAVLEQKAALDEQNELNRQELEIINEQIELYDALILEKEAELEEAIAAEEHQSELYRKRMRVMEEHGGMQYLSVLFQANPSSSFSRTQRSSSRCSK